MAKGKTLEDWQTLSYEASQLFSPSAPIDERDLFAGRAPQIEKTIEVVLERGKHVVIYGERGVGKTSLAKVFHMLFPAIVSQVLLIREQVDPTDDFSTIWHKVFKDISIRLHAEDVTSSYQLDQLYDDKLVPDDVRRALDYSFNPSQIPVIVIDEFDKAGKGDIRSLTANLIKYLSDYSINVTVIIIGVADDVEELLDEHESISRCIEQISMPRMLPEEMMEVINKRLPRLGMNIEADAMWKIITLARGLPSYVHLLGLFSVQDAIKNRKLTISEKNVDAAIQRSIEKSQVSVQQDYASAIHTNRSDTLFQEVLLACAIAKPDDLGLFSPGSVVAPLSSILGRDVTIANFQNHLKMFISDERSRILVRRGKERAYKFRFRDPMMQPYVIMKGVQSGLVDHRALDTLSSPAEPELPM